MEISLEKLFYLIRRKIWLILLCAAAGALVLFSYTKVMVDPTYVSTAKMVVVRSAEVETYPSEATYAQREVPTYIAILDDHLFYESVAKESGLDYDSRQVKRMISFSAVGETEVFQIQVTATSPKDSKILAETVAKVTIRDYKDVLERFSLKQVSDVRDGTLAGPNVTRNTLIGAILGALLVVAVIFLQDMLDTHIKTESDLVEHFDLPYLGTIPDFATGNAKKKKSRRK
ncbi:MAG: YveK family protein [Acutalibacteraceae bacterium]|jgi:succinoglycan biosynthesis transport protein ExoP